MFQTEHIKSFPITRRRVREMNRNKRNIKKWKHLKATKKRSSTKQHTQKGKHFFCKALQRLAIKGRCKARRGTALFTANGLSKTSSAHFKDLQGRSFQNFVVALHILHASRTPSWTSGGFMSRLRRVQFSFSEIKDQSWWKRIHVNIFLHMLLELRTGWVVNDHNWSMFNLFCHGNIWSVQYQWCEFDAAKNELTLIPIRRQVNDFQPGELEVDGWCSSILKHLECVRWKGEGHCSGAQENLQAIWCMHEKNFLVRFELSTAFVLRAWNLHSLYKCMESSVWLSGKLWCAPGRLPGESFRRQISECFTAPIWRISGCPWPCSNY